MTFNKIIGIALIVISLGAGFIGINKIADSTKTINFLGIKMESRDDEGRDKGYLYLGAAILIFAGGLYAIVKPKR